MHKLTGIFFLLAFVINPAVNAQQIYRQAKYIYTEPEFEATSDGSSFTNTIAKKPIFSFETITDISLLTTHKQAAKGILGYTKEKRPVEVYYFPGTSNKRALVIGGMHGSELSSIEVARELIEKLLAGDSLYYNVVIIPSLFPDNAAVAEKNAEDIGSYKNIGRYTHHQAPDPNRQMPSLGEPFNEKMPVDHLGRKIEYENGLLLDLINDFKPQRIVNIHAIRNTEKAGIFADPRTDAKGYALEYASDSSLAITMAKFIEENGGEAAGNNVDNKPTALYYLDPPVAAPGKKQKRNIDGSKLSGKRGHGVSLGGWASTAVENPVHPQNNRPAMRIFTMEFPGYKRSVDYTGEKKTEVKKQVDLYASSIQKYFLMAYFVEEEDQKKNSSSLVVVTK